MEIRGKVAVVTGGGSGIGRAIAVRLAREGAAVVVADVVAGDVGGTMEIIAAARGKADSVVADVTDASALRHVFERAQQRFGGMDILCNNAGVTTGAPFPDASIEQWQRVLDVNLRAVVLGTHLALPMLRQRGGGVVINTASMAAFVGFAPDPVYAATKAGVVLFTHSLGLLAADGIRVNCVCPGLVDTPLLKRGRDGGLPLPPGIPMMEPKEIADAVVELITDDSLAGQALRVAPGLHDFAPLPSLLAMPAK